MQMLMRTDRRGLYEWICTTDKRDAAAAGFLVSRRGDNLLPDCLLGASTADDVLICRVLLLKSIIIPASRRLGLTVLLSARHADNAGICIELIKLPSQTVGQYLRFMPKKNVFAARVCLCYLERVVGIFRVVLAQLLYSYLANLA